MFLIIKIGFWFTFDCTHLQYMLNIYTVNAYLKCIKHNTYYYCVLLAFNIVLNMDVPTLSTPENLPIQQRTNISHNMSETQYGSRSPTQFGDRLRNIAHALTCFTTSFHRICECVYVVLTYTRSQ